MNKTRLLCQFMPILLLIAVPGMAFSGSAIRSTSASIQAVATVVQPVGLEEVAAEEGLTCGSALLFRAPGSTGTCVQLQVDGICTDCTGLWESAVQLPAGDVVTSGLSLLSYEKLIESIPSGTRECTITVFVTEN